MSIIDHFLDRIQDSIQSSGTNRIIQLRHPRSDEAFMVYISTSEGGVFLNEVVKFEEPYSSWFIQNDVQSGLRFNFNV